MGLHASRPTKLRAVHEQANALQVGIAQCSRMHCQWPALSGARPPAARQAKLSVRSTIAILRPACCSSPQPGMRPPLPILPAPQGTCPPTKTECLATSCCTTCFGPTVIRSSPASFLPNHDFAGVLKKELPPTSLRWVHRQDAPHPAA